MFFWNCEAQSPFDYLLLVTAASGWIYAAWCLIQLRYERRTPLGREYHRRFFLSVLVGACAILLAVALCASR
jgi:hypothetical protein